MAQGVGCARKSCGQDWGWSRNTSGVQDGDTIRRQKVRMATIASGVELPPTNLRLLEKRIVLCKRGEPLRALYLFL